jgi:hypothetical protein
MVIPRKQKMAAAFVLIACAVAWIAYSPTHWLSPLTLTAVKVDGRPVTAKAYMGHPSHYESEAICLVHVPGTGDYFLDFENEKYRTASAKEFLHIGGGVWTLRDMRLGRFDSPLPFRAVNQFRIATSNGHEVEIQF